MNTKEPLISICIPCFKRIEQVRNTLRSIYYSNKDVSFEDFEVVISDNDPDCELKTIISEFAVFSNFAYYPTNCEGFMNSFYALRYGRGEFLKLHNSQNVFYPGSLAMLVSFIRDNSKTKPMCFFSNGWLSWRGLRNFVNFEGFMRALSYWSSSSAGFGIWKEDFDSVCDRELDPFFPHTSLFVTQFEKPSYVIDNRTYFFAQRIPRRGDHNKFRAFTVHYPGIIAESCQAGHISTKCRDRIYKGIYTEFLPNLLFNKYIAAIETYDISGFKENCSRYFPKSAYYLAWANVFFVPFRIISRRIRQQFFRS